MPAPPTKPGQTAAAGPGLSARSRLVLLAVVVSTTAVAVAVYEPYLLLTDGGWPRQALPPLVAVPLFALGYGVAAAVFVPRPVLGLAAGALFGLPLGLTAAVVGTVLGAALCFALGRVMGRDAVRPYLRGGRLATVDRQLGEHGFRSVLVLRLLPGVPFAASNYAASFSAVRWPVFLAATALGGVPHTLAYALAGSRADEPASAGFLAAVGLIGATGVAAVALARRRAGREAATAHG